MLTEENIIRIFCIIDDTLKAMNHRDDIRARISDSEVLTTGVISGLFFNGHVEHTRQFLKSEHYIPRMLSKSRLNRRLHRCKEFIQQFTMAIGQMVRRTDKQSEYILNSFPVPVCESVFPAAGCCKGKNGEAGLPACSLFYGVKVQLLISTKGIPMEFLIVPGSQAEVKALSQLHWPLPPESKVYTDGAYTDYQVEDWLAEADHIHLQVQRKSNSKRGDPPWTAFVKEYMRKKIETAISQLKALFARPIHAVTDKGFGLKLSLFMLAFTFQQVFL